ncbi:MAG: ABC transporter substrate-binding protein [Actinobacteria bacterium]|nr:MAG: ABC transporter substrate-binding protein [Actinomycetota bacterium]
MKRHICTFVAVAVLALILAACSSGSPKASGTAVLRLGYYPNLTHATAIVGVDQGIFAKDLGSKVQLKTSTFTAGPEEVTALFADALDAAYMGPNPAINAYIKSSGQAVRIISGATSGGAFLVVKKSINSAADLKGKTIAAPQLGNTQDVALRNWLKSKGLRTTTAGGGDVKILDQDNATSLDTFKQGQIDGAWVPEPWASRLVVEGGARVLVDERDLWPGGKYVTTQLVVRTAFLQQHPDVVENLLKGQVEANDFIHSNSDQAKQIVGAGIEKLTGKSLKPAVLDRAWANLTFTDDPIASSLRQSAAAALALGFISSSDLANIYDLTLLNKVLTAQGKQAISTA